MQESLVNFINELLCMFLLGVTKVIETQEETGNYTVRIRKEILDY